MFKTIILGLKYKVHYLPLVHSIESDAACRTIFMHVRPRKCGSFLGTVIVKQANLSMGLRQRKDLIRCYVKWKYHIYSVLECAWTFHWTYLPFGAAIGDCFVSIIWKKRRKYHIILRMDHFRFVQFCSSGQKK